MLNQAPMFSMTDREEASKNYRHSLLLSIPMQAYYSNQTIGNISYERVSIKLKSGTTRDDEQRLFNDIKDTVTADQLQLIHFSSKYRDNIEKVDAIISILFDVVIVITMFLCFFSLSSSMSANLYE